MTDPLYHSLYRDYVAFHLIVLLILLGVGLSLVGDLLSYYQAKRIQRQRVLRYEQAKQAIADHKLKLKNHMETYNDNPRP